MKESQKFVPTPPMLVNEISRLYHSKMRAADPHAMSQESSRLIMRVLSSMDGCSQLELVRQTHLKAPTVSVAVDRLQEAGYVVRKANPSDLRGVRVYLTPMGKQHNRTIRERLQAMDDILMKNFSEEEIQQFMNFLLRARDNILPN